MLKNYIKIAWRNLVRNRAYSLINTIGLSVGIASCLLIFLFIQDELSYDRFHKRAERIYRVVVSSSLSGTALIPAEAKNKLSGYPEVQASVRLYRAEKIVLIGEDNAIREKEFFYADSTFFDVFSFSLIKGDPSTVLAGPNQVVLTKSIAQKYFGDVDPIGQSLVLRSGQNFTVLGVVEDVPHNSHIQFDILASFISLNEPEGMDYQGFLYLLLNSTEAAVSLESKLANLTERSAVEISRQLGFSFRNIGFELQPITDIHLFPALNGAVQAQSDARYLYVFGIIGIFIMIIACINYMNLATASSTQRSREVGLRKTFGAHRQQLMGQFLTESILFTGLAYLLALSVAQLILPVFSTLTGKSLSFFGIQSWRFLGFSTILAIVVGFLSGSYPVLILSRFNPQKVMKGQHGITGSQPRLRQGLIIFQFTIATVLIVSTIIVQNQLGFIQDKRLGYEAEHVLSLPMTESYLERLSKGKLKPDEQRISTFKQKLAGVSGIRNVSVAFSTPNGYLTSEIKYRGESYKVTILPVDYDYINTMKFELISGRDFSKEHATDSTRGIIVNETAARLFNLKDKIGKSIDLDLGHPDPALIGIVKDFHTASFHHSIRPTVLAIQPMYYNSYVLRLQPQSLPGVLSRLEQTWDNLAPNYPFNFTFLDSKLEAQYRTEQRVGYIVMAFSILAIVIACLGLFGLAAYTAERRTKEIGIRKVLGATVSNIVTLLSKDFLKLVLLGIVIAVPVAWYAMNRWLQDFAYRIEIGASIFLMAGGAAVVIALLTVSWQSVQAALANPVESLRSE